MGSVQLPWWGQLAPSCQLCGKGGGKVDKIKVCSATIFLFFSYIFSHFLPLWNGMVGGRRQGFLFLLHICHLICLFQRRKEVHSPLLCLFISSGRGEDSVDTQIYWWPSSDLLFVQGFLMSKLCPKSYAVLLLSESPYFEEQK